MIKKFTIAALLALSLTGCNIRHEINEYQFKRDVWEQMAKPEKITILNQYTTTVHGAGESIVVTCATFRTSNDLLLRYPNVGMKISAIEGVELLTEAPLPLEAYLELTPEIDYFRPCLLGLMRKDRHLAKYFMLIRDYRD